MGFNAFSQVSITQGFETTQPFLPAGWQLNPAGTGGPGGTPNYWAGTAGAQSGTNNPGVTPHGGLRVARFRAYNNAAGIQQSLITAPIDYTGLGNNIAHFSFWMYRDTALVNAFDSLGIFVSTDTSLASAVRIGSVVRNCTIMQPDTATPNTWNQYTFYVPQTFVGDTNYIILRGYGQAGRNIYIDDVEYDAYPALCNGMPSIGTLSASTNMICGGAGVSQLTLSGTSFGLSGITLQWQYSTSPTGPWINTLANATTMSTDSISMPTYYRAYISCNSSGMSDTTAAMLVDISMNPAPTLTVSPAGTGFQGNQISYCNGTPGVVVSVTGAATYTWAPATGLSQTSGDSVLANPAAQTIYTIIGTDMNGCSSSKAIVVLPRNPPNINATASSDTICAGNSVTLTVQGGNNTYTWLFDGSTGTTATVTPAATTEYYVMATSNTTGCTRTDTVLVNVTAAASADFSFTVVDTTVTFTELLNNATLIGWSFGDNGNSTASNPVHNYSDSGTFLVTLIVSTPCGNDTVTKSVSISKGSGFDELSNKATFGIYPNPANSVIKISKLNLNNGADFAIYNAQGAVVLSKKINTTNNLNIGIELLTKGFYSIKILSNGTIYTSHFVKE